MEPRCLALRRHASGLDVTGNMWIGILAGLLMGPLIGSINGYLVTRQKMPSLMTTLGMMFTFRGLVYVYTKKTPIVDEQGFDAFVPGLYQGSIGPIPVPGLLALVLIAGAILVTTQTEFGRRIYAIGGNPAARRVSASRWSGPSSGSSSSAAPPPRLPGC